MSLILAIRPAAWLLPLATLFILCSCGVLKDDDEETQTAGTFASIQCNTRPVMRFAGEKQSVSFTALSESPMSLEFDPGKTELYLDWGGISATSGTSTEYTAPSFIPAPVTLGARKVDVVAKQDGALGRCSVYLLPPGVYGVENDNQVVGIPISIYKLTTAPTSMPNLATLTPSENNVLNQLNIATTANGDLALPIAGVTKEANTSNFAYEVKGTFTVQTAGDYQLTMNATNATGKVDSTVLVNGTAATINLSQGRHTVSISGYHTANTNFRVRLAWAKRISPTAFETPAVLIPAAAFDR